MTQNTSHNVWQYAFDHSPILNDTRLTFSVETYLIHETGEVSIRFAMGASKLLSYYCDDNNSGSLAMARQFADYRTAFNGWIKNVALSAPMGHAIFNHGNDEIADSYTWDDMECETYEDCMEARQVQAEHDYRTFYLREN